MRSATVPTNAALQRQALQQRAVAHPAAITHAIATTLHASSASSAPVSARSRHSDGHERRSSGPSGGSQMRSRSGGQLSSRSCAPARVAAARRQASAGGVPASAMPGQPPHAGPVVFQEQSRRELLSASASGSTTPAAQCAAPDADLAHLEEVGKWIAGDVGEFGQQIHKQLSIVKNELLAARHRLDAEARERRRVDEELSATLAAELERLRRTLDAEVSERHAAAKQLETRCCDLQSEVGQARSALEAEASARLRKDDSVSEQLQTLMQRIERSRCNSNGYLEACEDSQQRSMERPAARKGLGESDPTLLAAALGDAKQCLEDEVRSREQLSCDLDELRREVVDMESRIMDDVMRRGLEPLKMHVENLTCDAESRRNVEALAGLEAQVKSQLEAMVTELRKQETRIKNGALLELETRMEELSDDLREALDSSMQQKHPARTSDAALQEWQKAMEEENKVRSHDLEALAAFLREEVRRRDDQGAPQKTQEAMSVRMNELAGLLREELRRQDVLEGKLNELAGALHDELRRQEEVVIPEGLSALEGRLDRLSDVLREELHRQDNVARTSMTALEGQISAIAGTICEAEKSPSGKLSDLERDFDDRLAGETAQRNTELQQVRELLEAVRAQVEERDKDLWHALDTHTHDVAVDHRSAVAAAAALATTAGDAGRATPPRQSHASRPIRVRSGELAETFPQRMEARGTTLAEVAGRAVSSIASETAAGSSGPEQPEPFSVGSAGHAAALPARRVQMQPEGASVASAAVLAPQPGPPVSRQSSVGGSTPRAVRIAGSFVAAPVFSSLPPGMHTPQGGGIARPTSVPGLPCGTPTAEGGGCFASASTSLMLGGSFTANARLPSPHMAKCIVAYPKAGAPALGNVVS
eukprot:TRINITY_DN19681_c0_g1_i1.p1 TRINITY_DN19681_c0_g1~~TRINITY_DN19681_c0_g1_i1.p1  ORF type:complete len:880 (-),score=173.92 TRINITY_DN19681_c0_g1_i1:57-2696(-)